MHVVFPGDGTLQCQAEVLGAPTAEDLRGPSQKQGPEGGARRAQPHVDPRGSVCFYSIEEINMHSDGCFFYNV